MLAVAGDPPGGNIAVIRRGWTTRTWLARRLPSAPSRTMRVLRLSPPRRAPSAFRSMSIDKPAFCDFAFGAIVNRSPLVIGISTDGAAPVFAQAIRAKLEALLPKGFANWASAAARWRSAVKASGLSFSGRRKFWQVFTAHAVKNPDAEPTQTDFDRFVAEVRGLGSHRRKRLGHLGRRRSRRSGIAHAACGARAAIGRRDSVRRSGVARRARFCSPRGAQDCWSARPGSARPANRTISIR